MFVCVKTCTGVQMNVSVPFHQLRQQLESFIHTMLVICLFSGRYDLNVLKPYLLKHFSDNKNLTIKRTNQFILLSNNRLICLDNQMYLAMSTLINNTSASTTAPSLSVAVFPYQWIADLRKLDAPRLPPRNAFHSGLTGHTTTQGEYEDCQRAWQDKRMTSFREWLIPYNNMDTIPFSKAHFVGRWVGGDWGGGGTKPGHIFYGASLPGLTGRFLHNSTPEGTFFTLFNEKNKDLYHALRQSVSGGPSIGFSSHHEKGKTFLRQAEADKAPHRRCHTVGGYDANSLYLKSWSEPMPVGFYFGDERPASFVSSLHINRVLAVWNGSALWSGRKCGTSPMSSRREQRDVWQGDRAGRRLAGLMGLMKPTK